MKFGIQLPNCQGVLYPPDFVSFQSIRKIAESAEKLGFHSLWVFDHLVAPPHLVANFKNPSFYDAPTVMTALSTITNKIALGFATIILPFRDPAILAKQIATMDQISDGRIVLGVGAGRWKEEFDALGVPYEKRGAITNEYLRAIKLMWAQEEFSFNGKFIKYTNAAFFPKPKQKPHPPIWIGGLSDAAIRRAARYGDFWFPASMTPTELSEGMKKLQAADQQARRASVTKVSLSSSLRIDEIGGPTAIQEKIHTLPPAKSLVGTVREISAKLEGYAQVGVEHVTMPISHASIEDILRAMELFAKQIMPSFA